MAKAIMIQGTMSNVGKSLLTAGLCRVLWQDGYRVAPFKSQNMALNSYLTPEGLEMGRAQVVQAEACGRLPDVRMNPILLKPVTDMGSQVIVCGEVIGTMKAREYFAQKRSLIPTITAAYASLASECDVVVIEGAGSPAELNLKADDIVNMGMAKLADASVLLVGDIDRGGVFAQLIGTVSLLEPEEQQRIFGLIINKFRGDRSLLTDGIRILEEKSGKPVLGVLPFLEVDIEEEDSLADRLNHSECAAPFDVAVIRLPKLSNFTDFHALSATDGFSVRYVTKPDQLGSPDLIVLPGTKSTIADLCWLRETGLEAAIQKRAAAGTLILGICGGYQLLGERIDDPDHTESSENSVRGMGLLPIKTVFSPEKQRRLVEGQVGFSKGAWSFLEGAHMTGYEIHMGISHPNDNEGGWISLADGSVVGCVRENVAGCYLHGFFDSEEIRKKLQKMLAERHGISPEMLGSFDFAAYKEQQYNKLADAVRESLDMEAIYAQLGKEPSCR